MSKKERIELLEKRMDSLYESHKELISDYTKLINFLKLDKEKFIKQGLYKYWFSEEREDIIDWKYDRKEEKKSK